MHFLLIFIQTLIRSVEPFLMPNLKQYVSGSLNVVYSAVVAIKTLFHSVRCIQLLGLIDSFESIKILELAHVQSSQVP
jgi:hypothetical protein